MRLVQAVDRSGCAAGITLATKNFRTQMLCFRATAVKQSMVDRNNSMLVAHRHCARRMPGLVRRRHGPCCQKFSNSNTLLLRDRSQTVDGPSKQLHTSSTQALCQAHAWLGAHRRCPCRQNFRTRRLCFRATTVKRSMVDRNNSILVAHRHCARRTPGLVRRRHGPCRQKFSNLIDFALAQPQSNGR